MWGTGWMAGWRRRAPAVAAAIALVGASLSVSTTSAAQDAAVDPAGRFLRLDSLGAGPDFTWPVDAARRAVAAATTPTGDGAYLVAGDGTVSTAGAARHVGDAAGLPLAAPVVAMAADPDGDGYWLAGADGGVLSFGAPFAGSMAEVALDAPVTAMAVAPGGAGYWLAARDGGVFAFGGARFLGSLGGERLDAEITAMAATPTGWGYLLLGGDGGVFAFGDAVFGGSLAGELHGGERAVGITVSGPGYQILTSDGRLARFGPRTRSTTNVPLDTDQRPLGLVAADADPAWVLSTPVPASFTIAFTGDVLPHASVLNTALRDGSGGTGPNGSIYDFGPMFAEVAPFVAEADLAICHLETTLAHDDRHHRFPRFQAPASFADTLVAVGYEGCSVSSNHVLDFDFAGVHDTIEELERVGLGHAGSARTAEESQRLTTYDVGGVTVANFSYSYGFNGRRPPRDAPWAANLIDADRIEADAARARSAGADLVVVSLHWGAEYRVAVARSQRDLAARLLASPDIDLLIGHHAHVVNPIERIDGEYVVYGLGNFLSGQSQPRRRDGIVVYADVSMASGRAEVTGIRYQPTWVDRPNVIRIATPDGPLSASHRRTVEAVELHGPDDTIRPLS